MKTPSKILFVIFPVPSHFLSVFGISRQLQNEGHAVVFAAENKFQQLVITQGFRFMELNSKPYAQGFEDLTSQTYLDGMVKRIIGDNFANRKGEFENIIETLEPDYVLLDSFLSTDIIFFCKSMNAGILKLAFVQTMLSTSVNVRYPIITKQTFPNQRIKIIIEYLMFIVWLRIKFMVHWIIYLGFDDISLLKKEMAKHNLKSKHALNIMRMFAVGFKDVDEFLLCPEEFDFAALHKEKSQHYIGFIIDVLRKNRVDAFPHDAINIKGLRRKYGGDVKIVYCSFGTFGLVDQALRNVVIFLKRLQKTAKNEQKTFFYIAASNSVLAELEQSFDPLENLYLSSFLPQLHILSSADLFINHGGLNSIKEAIHFKVPLLLYPYTKNFDSYGNVAKAVYAGIAIKGSITSDSSATIGKRIRLGLENGSFFKDNLEKLHRTNLSYIGVPFSSHLKTL